MFQVRPDGDKVIVALSGRRRDVLVTCGEAERFEHALRSAADVADREPPELVRGEQWGLKVESYDGLVAVRFDPPFGSTADRVPLPSAAARQLADLVEFKRQQAAYRMRFAIERV